jgi:transcriptional regulator with XRE-family HTH domain
MKREWLIQKREAKKMSQEVVAEKLGVSRPYYGMIETGIRNPSVGLSKKIAKVFGFKWTIFFEDKGNEKKHNNKEVG